MAKKILVVDDEEIFLIALSEELKKAGFDVVGAKNGEEGVKQVLAEKPDLVLLDLLMPKVDGITALKMIKNNEEIKNIPVVILTNFPNELNISKALSMGVADYLVKGNYTMEELITKIKTIIVS